MQIELEILKIGVETTKLAQLGTQLGMPGLPGHA